MSSQRPDQSTGDSPVEHPSGKKNRPTPTRRQAEEARKQALRGPQGGRARRKYEREERARQRAESRERMLAGDDRYLPARDQGPVRKEARFLVDSRRSIGEFFIPLAMIVVLSGFIPHPAMQWFMMVGYVAVILLVIIDSFIVSRSVDKQLAKKWPNPAERKGVKWYVITRSMQLRRLRMPPPQVKPGGAPVTPKTQKEPKAAKSTEAKTRKSKS